MADMQITNLTANDYTFGPFLLPASGSLATFCRRFPGKTRCDAGGAGLGASSLTLGGRESTLEAKVLQQNATVRSALMLRLTAAVNAALLRLFSRVARVESEMDELLDRRGECLWHRDRDVNPDDLVAYLFNVGCSWVILVFPTILVEAVFVVIGDHIAGQRGTNDGVALGSAIMVACAVGAADAWSRNIPAALARRRYRANGWVINDQIRKGTRAARFNDATVALQLIAATLVLLHSWT